VVAGSAGSVQTVGVRRFKGIVSSFLFRIKSHNCSQWPYRLLFISFL